MENRNKFRCLLIMCALVFSAPTLAGNAGWTVSSKVVRLVVTANGGVNVRLSPELSGCTSQSGYGGRYASIYPSHPGIMLLQSNLLAAYMSGKEVALWLNDDKCTVGEISFGGTHFSS
jgi:hypothetical protein